MWSNSQTSFFFKGMKRWLSSTQIWRLVKESFYKFYLIIESVWRGPSVQQQESLSRIRVLSCWVPDRLKRQKKKKERKKEREDCHSNTQDKADIQRPDKRTNRKGREDKFCPKNIVRDKTNGWNDWILKRWNW